MGHDSVEKEPTTLTRIRRYEFPMLYTCPTDNAESGLATTPREVVITSRSPSLSPGTQRCRKDTLLKEGGPVSSGIQFTDPCKIY